MSTDAPATPAGQAPLETLALPDAAAGSTARLAAVASVSRRRSLLRDASMNVGADIVGPNLRLRSRAHKG